MAARKIFNVRLSPQERAIVQHHADDLGLSSNELIRKLIHGLATPPDLQQKLVEIGGDRRDRVDRQPTLSVQLD